MEFDSVSLDSDEGVELSVNEHGYYPEDFLYAEEENQQMVLEAKTVYLLLPKNIPVSRAARLQWLLNHLNSVITMPTTQKWNNSTEIEIVSIVPREQLISKCNKFQITGRTELKFLAHSYRIVYCLDMSPSQATIDIQKGEVLFDEIFDCFKHSLEGLTQQFTVPGNPVVFKPNIYLTVIVNTPFFMSPAQQVLVKGVEITSTKLPEIIKFVGDQFHIIEGKIAEVATFAYDQMDSERAQNESNVLNLNESERFGLKISMVSPDANFVNMLRYSMLAISLLPENSISNILVITDGVVSMPDANILESLLFQLHYDCISVSFLKVGSPFHPHSSSGFVSYTDLLYFFAHSTLGTCLQLIHNINYQSFTMMNIYHQLFLVWSFHTKNTYGIPQTDSNVWSSENEIFRGFRKPNLLTKRQSEEKSSASILLLLSRRMREGFTIDHISYINGLLEVKLSLEWKSSIFIYFKLATQWPVTKSNSTLYEIFIAAPYEFLHDITCLMKKENKSSHRIAIIERFWLRLSQLTGEIGFAQQLSTFPTSSLWHNLPDSARSGIPVFVVNNPLGPDSTKSSLIPSDVSCPKFNHLWQPICQMEGNSWRKWFHMHKISLVLKHDQLLPKGLHLNQTSRRYETVQCRQAAAALYGFLSEWSTFILIDNNTYLRILKEPDKPPVSFCIIRITSKLPCAVLHIGFFTPTPGFLRKEVIEQLKTDISQLAYTTGPLRMKENTICVLFEKPIEKVLIRYERMPHDFSTVIFPDGTQPPHSNLSVTQPLTSSLFTTLSRYLYHKRCIWGASYSFNYRLSDTALSWILNTITKMRLEEGFHFAHSSAGILTMVMELWMDPYASCLVQYVLFPVNYSESNGWGEDSNSCSDDDNNKDCDGEAELQLVTEVWIEPQFGKVQTTNKRITYFNDKYYYEIANMICHIDHNCINTLLTMEHLSLMCQEKNRAFSIGSSTNLFNVSSVSQKTVRKNSKLIYHQETSPRDSNGFPWYPIVAPRIEHIPFNFDPIAILPFCQQTELLFSLFVEGNEKLCFHKGDISKANKLLMDNIHDHFMVLHDSELDLTKEESDKFTKHVIKRNKTRDFNSISEPNRTENSEEVSQWRCLLKGISVSHVILTFFPATLDDLRVLMASEKSDKTTSEQDFSDRPCSSSSNISDVPIHSTNSLILPVYVYDCPLRVLVNAHVKNLENNFAHNKDVYEDHRFKFTEFIQEESVGLKEESTQNSPESKSDDSDSSDSKNNARIHCRALVLAHSKSFVLSLFVALHFDSYILSSDIQSAMDQCEESITEIDITNYMMTVCGHVKNLKDDKISIKMLNQPAPCSELKPIHSLIKEKFFQLIRQSFSPIPTNNEFYFCRSVNTLKKDIKQQDSDDDISNLSEAIEPKSDNEVNSSLERSQILQRMESGFSGISDVHMPDVYPLFLQLICTIRYNNGGDSNVSVRVLPTCLGEVIQNIESEIEVLDRTKLHISLDILCLTLPSKVQNVITEYSSKGLRTTSFCSDGFQPSIGSPDSETSFTEIQDPETLVNLPDYQQKSIVRLRDEIKWLLKDEIATALLDVEPVTSSTLNTIVSHVSHSTGKPSCDIDKINLNFVYNTAESYNNFVEEFSKIVVSPYKLCKKEDYFYLVKETPLSHLMPDAVQFNSSINDSSGINEDLDIFRSSSDQEKVKDEIASQPSDISSINGSILTDGGYEEDVSEDYEDYDWLTNFDMKRPNLPNFWLIMKVDHDVTIYFHCRFLELPTPKVGIYLEIQRAVRDAIRDLCKRVNQALLLQMLCESKICNSLLEPDDDYKDWHSEFISSSPRASSFNRLKSVEGLISENKEEIEASKLKSETDSRFKVGEFSCPVVWQTNFILHPRLKTGSGKSIISRGVLALKNILDKFSVFNRNNMFVYKDQMKNVFYLRLQENMQPNCGKNPSLRPNEYETALVSRSPSIASLPLGHKGTLGQSDASISSSASSEIRPRVRSFGEKESKNSPNEDTLILKVHGITAVGRDVQYDLVQVLQNRLDDAVLEFLSITLARNAMCPLTPEDVRFIQKPFRPPEVVIRLTIEEFALGYLESFIHYLKQNLLQFLNIPKYTDLRSRCHFQDFPENDSPNNMVSEDNIFIYNQSQNPSSGNRGIACIVLNLINNVIKETQVSDTFKTDLENKKYKNIISTRVIKAEDPLPDVYLEFRLWKQGRVNIDNLIEKLNSTVCQSVWDLVTEYFLLTQPLCVEDSSKSDSISPICIDELDFDSSKELEFNVLIKSNKDSNLKTHGSNITKTHTHGRNKKRAVVTLKRKTSRSITFDNTGKEKGAPRNDRSFSRPTVELSPLENGNEGILSETYSKYLPDWLEFGVNLSVPSVRKHRVTLTNRHLVYVSIREVLNLIQDTSKAFTAVPTNALKVDDRYKYVVYIPSNSVQKCVMISRNFEHWKANKSFKEHPELLELISPQVLKHTQKFTPLATNIFVPRQKILWAFIENDNIIIYTYNWTKEKIDKLVSNCTNLGLWLSVRSCFLNSLTAQKLGLFHNQYLARKNFLSSNNPYVCYIGNVEYMRELPKDIPRRTIANTNLAKSLDVFRDAFQKTNYPSNDIVVILTIEMREVKSWEEKWNEEMKKLHSMYQSRTSSTTVPLIFLLMQNSRIIHYCHTPLLFLPKWRLKSAATRDHNLYPNTHADQIALRKNDPWHSDLCYGFFCEYRRYLQTLGFMPLQFDNNSKPGMWSKDNSSYDSVFYIQKTILGGILLFTAEFVEPFFTTKLHAIECNRLQNISSRASINRFTLSFLDECDRVKMYMHLHSFTYDYHLRSVHNYISNNSGINRLCENYNLNQFLDDFLKYYNKAPNFARNLVHEDTLTIKDLLTEGKQLYEYLLQNIDQYNFKTLKMEKNNGEIEQILVQVTTTSQVHYTDSQDCHHTDDFDITLVICNLCFPYSPSDYVLHLKYYLILTSKREMYPAIGREEKLGKFKTVSSASRSILGATTERDECVSNQFKPENFEDISSISENEHDDNELNNEKSNVTYIEISTEKVNYLGYYSSHEELMQKLILEKAQTTHNAITSMVKKGMVQCRSDLLWNKLLSSETTLTYNEFVELKNLSRPELLCNIHPHLSPLLNQPISWYEGLSKLLLVKYNDNKRTFISLDGNVQQYVILHPNYYGAFMLLSMDLHMARGDLYAVYREMGKNEDLDVCRAYRKQLLDGFVNCIAFYLWSGMI